MGVKQFLRTRLAQLFSHAAFTPRTSAVAALALGVAAASLGMAEAAVHAGKLSGLRAVPELAVFTSGAAPKALTLETRTVWEGADLDGDGQPDIANPTGQAPRGTDAYGEGRFHASRDGGARDHEGVDYVATAGQAVSAPISGYVSKIGYAYPDDQTLRFVEIDNPALHLTARVFYVDPAVAVGDTVAVGQPIGQAHSLQRRYPLGITDHIHLEIAERGRKVDAEKLIVARAETGAALGD
ncbi:M23 family metallopeptidase [Phenylobacterium sp.]|uniref:M23 family metallopeptidase n=1 Tax=Phenylobacterium sp. TaxID=1871053 RepID=UPI002CED0DFF|nr:M23 family metallopeptidase [Phenylobacterium sp.]HLZ75433.1 M23 family metallopeptidase [Phenylobacterium sp.]